MKITQKIFNAIFKVVELFSAVVLGAVTIVAFYQIVSRYILQSSNAGIDELTRLAFVWCASLGGALAFRSKSHLGVTALINKLSGKPRIGIEICIYLVLIVFFSFVFSAGITMTKMGMMQYSEYLRIKMALFYACIPAGAGFSILSFIEIIIQQVRRLLGKEQEVKA